MVDVELIKKLREMTGAGVADCRAALEETKGNLEKAIEEISKRGLAKAEKKSERNTSQGRVFSYTHSTGKVGVIVSLLCETDFVAKTEDFQNLGKEICLQIASMNPKDVEELLAQEYIRDTKLTVSAMIKLIIGKLGENIKVDKFSRIEL